MERAANRDRTNVNRSLDAADGLGDNPALRFCRYSSSGPRCEHVTPNEFPRILLLSENLAAAAGLGRGRRAAGRDRAGSDETETGCREAGPAERNPREVSADERRLRLRPPRRGDPDAGRREAAYGHFD